MSQPELLKTFNCGIGMIAVVAADRAEALADLLRAEGETVVHVGPRRGGRGRDLQGQTAVKRVAVLISGGGSNMLALLRDMVGDHPGRAVFVGSNDPAAPGLVRAAEMGVAGGGGGSSAVWPGSRGV